MRLPLLASLSLFVGSWASAVDFASQPPHPIAGFTSFEVLGGELASTRLKAGYRFYVDPARAALFTVMRYRVRHPGGAASPTEKFVWNERTGQQVPLRCFEWVETAPGGGAWREMISGEPAYENEMATLLLVLSEQNRAYRQQVEREARQ